MRTQRKLAALLVLMAMLAMQSVKATSIGSSSVITSLTLGTKVLMMEEGETIGLSYSYFPDDADVSGIIWTSSDENVAVVSDDAIVVARCEGTCTITASYGEGLQEQCLIFVSNVTGSSDGHDYVDLGLPSGTLWAMTNIGADSPEESGSYLQWGETQEHEADYNWTTYGFCKGTATTLTKYCTDSKAWAGDGDKDGLTKLDVRDDAAYALWGAYWRMPSIAQFEELVNINYTTCEPSSLNGVEGFLITSRMNGKCIFLPAASSYSNGNYIDTQNVACYWSSTLSGNSALAHELYLSFSEKETSHTANRCDGLSVRPVYEGIRNNTDLTVSPTQLDFGTVALGSIRSLSFDIKNNTYESQTILPFVLGLEDFSIDWSGGELAANATQRVTVTYIPSSIAVANGCSFFVGSALDSTLVNVTAASHQSSSALTTKQNLVVWLKNGSKATFILNEKPIVTIHDRLLTIESTSANAEYNFNDVQRLTYEGLANDISMVESDTGKPFQLTSEALAFFSDREDLNVKVVSLSGIVVRQFTVSRGSVVSLPLNQFSTGVYVINVNQISYKITIR